MTALITLAYVTGAVIAYLSIRISNKILLSLTWPLWLPFIITLAAVAFLFAMFCIAFLLVVEKITSKPAKVVKMESRLE